MAPRGFAKIGKQQAAAGAHKRAVLGEKALARKIKHLGGKGAVNIAQAGIRGSVQELAKVIKRDVPSRFKQARKGVGWKATKGHAVSKRRKNAVAAEAKAGVGVGMKKKKREALVKKHKASRAGRPGAGIGPGNFHWWVIGTKQRYTRGGKYTGWTRSYIPGFATKAAMKGKAAIFVRSQKSMRTRLLFEAKKA